MKNLLTSKQQVISHIMGVYCVAHITQICEGSCTVICTRCKYQHQRISLHGWVAIKCLYCSCTIAKDIEEYSRLIEQPAKVRYIVISILRPIDFWQIQYEIIINEELKTLCIFIKEDASKFLRQFPYFQTLLDIYPKDNHKHSNIRGRSLFKGFDLPNMTCSFDISIRLLKS